MTFLNYISVKNKVCLLYLGYYEWILNDLIKYQQKHNEMELYICSRDNMFDIISSQDKTLKYSEYNTENYAYTYEIKYNLKDNPVNNL